MLGFLARKKKDPQAEMRRVLGDYELPSFPGVVMQTLQRLRDPDASPQQIAAVLSGDPGLSITILKAVNSASYALRRRVDSVEQAITLLGFSTVESLVLSVAVGNALPKTPAPGFDSKRFWLAAARRAATARSLASRLHPARAAESFTAALLQDMALPVLACEQSAKYGPVLEHWHNNLDDLAALEQAEFGWNHPEVATWMCNEWSLPEGLACSIGAHHGVHGAGNEGLECPPAVALVSHLRESEKCLGTDRIIQIANEQYGLNEDDTSDLIDESFEAAEDLARLFV